MAQIVTNIIQNSLSGFVTGAVTTVGGYAGDAINGVGNMIEAQGQSIGDGIANKIDGMAYGFTKYGNSIRSATAPNASRARTTGTTKTSTKPAVAKKDTAGKSTTKKSLASGTDSGRSARSQALPKHTTSKAVVPYQQPLGKDKLAKATSVKKPGSAFSVKQAPSVASKAGSRKNKTNTAGKVIPQKQSVSAARNSAQSVLATAENSISKQTHNDPLGNLASINKPKSKTADYAGPLSQSTTSHTLNVGSSLVGAGKKTANSVKPSASSYSSFVGGNKPGKTSYQGPLGLGGLA